VWVLKEYPKGTFPWPRSASVAAREGKRLRNFYANVDRASRNTVAVRDVDYLVEAWILLSANAGPEDNLAKFCERFERRLTKGQDVYQTYLGFIAEHHLRCPRYLRTRCKIRTHTVSLGVRAQFQLPSTPAHKYLP
jgi:hypothetical protein